MRKIPQPVGRPRRHREGKLTDLVLLDANPLEDIGNTKRIAAVVCDGRYLSKEAREKTLADIETVGNKK